MAVRILVTILAFVFVPMSLGTSIFGMNINELNETGQPLWVFIATTFSIFTVSTLTWGFSYQLHKYHTLPESKRYEQRPERPTVQESSPGGVVLWQVRLYQFLRLIWHGHAIWAWKSGIAFSLLTGGKKGFIMSCSDEDRHPNASAEAQDYMDHHIWHPSPHEVHEPCAYIIFHLDLKMGFECAKLETTN